MHSKCTVMQNAGEFDSWNVISRSPKYKWGTTFPKEGPYSLEILLGEEMPFSHVQGYEVPYDNCSSTVTTQ